MRRKSWFKSSIVGLSGLALVAGCAGAPAETGTTSDAGGSEGISAPVEITFQAWAPGSEEATAAFNAAQDEIVVTFEQIPGGGSGGYEIIRAGAKAGEAGDVVQVEFEVVPSFVVSDVIIDISEFLPAEAQSKYAPFAWSQVALGGGVFGAPLDMGPLGMMYRSDLFEELGLSVPTTWDEFRSVAAEVKAAGSSIYLGNYDPSWAAMFAGLSWQAGAQWFTAEEDGWTVNIDSPETIKVAEYWQGLVNDDLISREGLFSPPLAQLYQNGDLLTNIGAVWESALLQGNVPDQAGKWTAAPLPQWGAGESLSGNWGGSSWAVSASSTNPEAAAKFAYWLTTNEEAIDIYIRDAGIFPASLDGQQLPAITTPSDFFGGQAHLSVFAEISEGVNTEFEWGPNMLSSNPIIQARLVEAFDNNTSVAEALRLVNEEVKADLIAQGFTVR